MPVSAKCRPTSLELRSLSTFKFELHNIESRLATCSDTDKRDLEIVKRYMKQAVEDITARM